jgi:hypothetical protein
MAVSCGLGWRLNRNSQLANKGRIFVEKYTQKERKKASRFENENIAGGLRLDILSVPIVRQA